VTTDAARAAEHAARVSYGKLLAILSSRTGDIIGAEDALADAFAAALATWPRDGVPDRPEAWLLTTARNRRIDAMRKSARLVLTDEVPDMPAPFPDPDALPDDRLKLMFVCAHPAIDDTLHTPLMLQTVLGLEAADIARAYLIPGSTMAQRLVRVKRKIRDARLPFTLPQAEDLPQRLGAVLEAVYGAYTIDWQEGAGDLSHEALFLATTLADLMPDAPEALGLAAMICFIEARRKARVVDDTYVPLPGQDTGLWDGILIAHATRFLARAAAFGQIGRFQLEAAIQSVHANRADMGRTDWRAISQLYAALRRLHPTVGTAVGQSAAVSEDAGPEEGLRLLDLIDPAAVAGYQPYWATRAHLLARMGQAQQAAAAYEKAISLCTDAPSRRWLGAQRERIKQRLP